MSSPLPPPPSVPQRPPPVRLECERALTFPNLAGDGVLDARIARLDPARAVLLCHPHPLYGGTLHNAVIVAIAREAQRRGLSTLRFGYRGVERSTGRYDQGEGEADDVRAALAHLLQELPRATVDLVGYSFGSYVAVRALSDEAPAAARSLTMVAPVPRVFDYPALPATVRVPRVLLGEHDAYCDEDEGRAVAARYGAPFERVAGADHVFATSRRAVAAIVVDGVESVGAPG